MLSKLTKFFAPQSHLGDVTEEAKTSARKRTNETSRRLQSIEAEIKLEGLRAQRMGNGNK